MTNAFDTRPPRRVRFRRETWIALLLAFLCLALALAGAGTVVLVDIDQLRIRVGEYLGVIDATRIELPPPDAVPPEGIAEGGEGLLLGGDDPFLSSVPVMPESGAWQSTLLPTDIHLALPAASSPPEHAPVAIPLPDAAPRDLLPKRLPEIAPRPLGDGSGVGSGLAGLGGEASFPGAGRAEAPPSEAEPSSLELPWRNDPPAPPPLSAAARPDDIPLAPPPPVVPVAPRPPPAAVAAAPRPESPPSLDDDLDVRLFTYRPGGGERGFFRLDLDIRPDSRLATFPKEVHFLVDVSGSIPRAEIRGARDGISDYLAAFPPADRVNAAVFAQTARTAFDRFLPLAGPEGPARRAAIEKLIAPLDGQRRTNVYQAVETALSGLRNLDPDRPVHIFLVSDGVATDQVAETRRIVQQLRRADRAPFAIFAFDAGPPGNAYLLSLLALRSRGEYRHEPNVANMAAHLADWFRSLDEPVLIDAVVNRTSSDARTATDSDVHPRVLPNLYRGRTLSLWGRMDGDGAAVVRVAGRSTTGMREFFFRAGTDGGTPGGPEIARGWALGRAHEELAALVDHPDAARFDALRQLCASFGLSEITALLDDRAVVRALSGTR